jgi:hypothetical protein
LLALGCSTTHQPAASNARPEEVAEEPENAGEMHGDASCVAGATATFTREDAFAFTGPCELTGGPVQGTDSWVGQYQTEGLKLTYDFGGYSSPLTEWERYAEYTRSPAVVDGRDAVIVTARDGAADDGLSYLTGIYIEHASSDGAKLCMHAGCAGEAQRKIVLKIFETLAFDR